MRLVKIQTPAGQAATVAHVAFAAGITEVSITQERIWRPQHEETVVDVVNLATSTPTAKTFIEALMSEPFFDPNCYTINVRQPRTLVSSQRPAALTRPVSLPTVDILEDLWIFSHTTVSFVLRVVIAALLLAYGMCQDNPLLMIAGLLFMPFLPLLLGLGFGLRTREGELVRHAGGTLLLGLCLVTLGGAVVGLLTRQPLKFQQFSSLLPSLAVSCGVGVAASIATADDGGRRELIGLAATAQLALVPAWLGLSLVRGFSNTTPTGSPTTRLISFALNLLVIVAAAALTYTWLGVRSSSVHSFIDRTAPHDVHS